MNDSLATTIATVLAAGASLAELHLLWRFLADWREGQRTRKRRVLRSTRARTPHFGARTGTFLALTPLTAAPALSQVPQPAAGAASPPPLTISADRPGFSDGTGIVQFGHLNLESGYTFTFRDHDKAQTQRHNAPELLLRVGLVEDRLEARLSTSGYTWARSSEGEGFQSTEGWSDVSLGLKLKLTDQDSWLPRLAFEAQSTLGIGTDGISDQSAEPTLKLIWSYDLGKSFGDDWSGFTVGGNANVAWLSPDSDRFVEGQASLCVSFPIAVRLTGFGEYYLLASAASGSHAAHTFDFGAAYLLLDRVQLDARIGVGLNQEADTLFAGVGICILF